MAEPTAGLEVLIKAILDSRGFDQLKQNLQQAAAQTKEHKAATDASTESSKAFGSAIDDLGGKLATAVGELAIANEAFGFLKESLKGAIEASRVIDQMTISTNVLGGATHTTHEEMKAWIESVELASGKTKEELAPAYVKLITVTNDVSTAQRLVQVAAGAAAAGLGDVSQNAQVLTQWFATGKLPARVRGVGAEIKALTLAGKAQAEILEILQKRHGDAGASVDNLGIKVDRAKAQWRLFKEAIGDSATSLVAYLKPAFETIALVITNVIKGVSQLGGDLGVIASSMGTAMRGVVELLHGNFKIAGGYFKDFWTDLKSGFAEVNKDAQKKQDELLGIFHKGTEGLNKDAKAMTPPIQANKDALKALEDEYKKLLAEAATSVGGQEAIWKAELAVYKKMADDMRLTDLMRAEAKKKVVQTLMQLTTSWAHNEEATQKQITKIGDEEEKAFLKRETEKIAAYQKSAAERIKIATIEAKNRGKSEAELEKILARIYEQEANDYQLSEEKRDEAAAKGSDLRRKIAQQEFQNEIQIAKGTIALAGEVFGQSRELSIATALINTYQGVTGALSMQPWTYMNIVMAALVLAQGLAQVANIESTPAPTGGGIGFDDPRNDFAAYVGGQKWASDMVQRWAMGASAGFSSGMMGGGGAASVTNITNTNRSGDRHSHYNIHGLGLIDSSSDVMLRRFIRRLQAIERLEGKRTLA